MVPLCAHVRVLCRATRRIRGPRAASPPAGGSSKPRTPPGAGALPGIPTVKERLLLDDGEHVARREHQVLLAGVANLGAAVLGVQHDVALGDVDRNAVALVVDAARADGEDGALLRLLLGGVGNDDAGRGG